MLQVPRQVKFLCRSESRVLRKCHRDWHAGPGHWHRARDRLDSDTLSVTLLTQRLPMTVSSSVNTVFRRLLYHVERSKLEEKNSTIVPRRRPGPGSRRGAGAAASGDRGVWGI
jgi:hypothetical protein